MGFSRPVGNGEARRDARLPMDSLIFASDAPYGSRCNDNHLGTPHRSKKLPEILLKSIVSDVRCEVSDKDREIRCKKQEKGHVPLCFRVALDAPDATSTFQVYYRASTLLQRCCSNHGDNTVHSL